MNRSVKILLSLGIVLTIGPFLIGAGITVISMISAFRDLSQQGITDPHQLSAHIGQSLVATFIGILFMPLGIALLITSGIVYVVTKPSQKSVQTPP